MDDLDEHLKIAKLVLTINKEHSKDEGKSGTLEGVISSSVSQDSSTPQQFSQTIHDKIAEYTQKLRPTSDPCQKWDNHQARNGRLQSVESNFAVEVNSPGLLSVEDPFSSTFDEILDFEEQSILSSPGSMNHASSVDLLITNDLAMGSDEKGQNEVSLNRDQKFETRIQNDQDFNLNSITEEKFRDGIDGMGQDKEFHISPSQIVSLSIRKEQSSNHNPTEVNLTSEVQENTPRLEKDGNNVIKNEINPSLTQDDKKSDNVMKRTNHMSPGLENETRNMVLATGIREEEIPETGKTPHHIARDEASWRGDNIKNEPEGNIRKSFNHVSIHSSRHEKSALQESENIKLLTEIQKGQNSALELGENLNGKRQGRIAPSLNQDGPTEGINYISSHSRIQVISEVKMNQKSKSAEKHSSRSGNDFSPNHSKENNLENFKRIELDQSVDLTEEGKSSLFFPHSIGLLQESHWDTSDMKLAHIQVKQTHELSKTDDNISIGMKSLEDYNRETNPGNEEKNEMKFPELPRHTENDEHKSNVKRGDIDHSELMMKKKPEVPRDSHRIVKSDASISLKKTQVTSSIPKERKVNCISINQTNEKLPVKPQMLVVPPLPHETSAQSELQEVLSARGIESTTRPLQSVKALSDASNNNQQQNFDIVTGGSKQSFKRKRAMFANFDAKTLTMSDIDDNPQITVSNNLKKVTPAISKEVKISSNSILQKIGNNTSQQASDKNIKNATLSTPYNCTSYVKKSKNSHMNTVFQDSVAPPLPPLPASYHVEETETCSSVDDFSTMLKAERSSCSGEITTFEQRREKELDDILHAMQTTVQKMEEDCSAALPGPQDYQSSSMKKLRGPELDMQDNFGN